MIGDLGFGFAIGGNPRYAVHMNPPMVATAAIPSTSFSLFDMMDSSSSSSFAFPTRITADKVIEAHRRSSIENNTIDHNSCDDDVESAISLLEKADDIEDLSPDPEIWEEIRLILYYGLTQSPDIKDVTRYITVHVMLHKLCLGNGTMTVQLWDLVWNLIESILFLSRRLYAEKDGLVSDSSKDLCQDILQSILNVLTCTSKDYIFSGVGREREIETTILGMCNMLSDDYTASIWAKMEPYVGTFEIWSRFVDPDRLASIIYASELGGMAMQRCERCLGNKGCIKTDENFIQSLSILRTIVFRCHWSRHYALSMTTYEYTHRTTCSTRQHINFKDFHLQIEKAEQDLSEPNQLEVDDAIRSLLTPFLHIIRLKESDGDSVHNDLELLCIQTIEKINKK